MLRRVVSWTVTVPVLAALGVALARLPGGGGIVPEIRWRIVQGGVPAQANSAFRLLVDLGDRSPLHLRDAFAALLRDGHPAVVDWALTALPTCRHSFPDAHLDEVFLAWYREADASARRTHRASLEACRLSLGLGPQAAPDARVPAARPPDAAAPATTRPDRTGD